MISASECISQWISALASGDHDRMNDLLHPDFRLFEPEGLSYRGIYEGREGWWTFWDRFGKTWTDISITNHKIFAGSGGEECALMMDLAGRSIRTGRTFDTTLMEYWRFRDGKILEMHPHYRDTRYLADIESELGG